MFKKNLKRVLAMILAATMMLSVVACGGKEEAPAEAPTTESSETAAPAETDEFAWLNTSGTLPIVAEGTEKTLRMAIRMDVNSPNPEDTWFFKFIEEEMNINLEVDKFTKENISEYIAMMFADGDLPDIIIDGGLGTADLINYGLVEGQIMDLAPYINEKNTPNLYKIYQENPEYKTAVTDGEGHVWSLGYINDPADRGQIARAFLNYDWLEEAGLEVPTTLDDFLDVLRAFKERGKDVVPMGGAANAAPPLYYIINAFGYNTQDASGLSIALRDGKVVLPAADKEAWGAYLETLNTMYDEGLIHPDYFTMDGTATSAILAEDRVGFIPQAPFVFQADNAKAWWGAVPLTSEYNDTPFWPVGNSVSAGKFVVSADCEEPELAMAFADWFFNAENYAMSANGPSSTQTEYHYDMTGGYIVDPETKALSWADIEANPDLYASSNDLLNKKILLQAARVLGLGSKSDALVRMKLSGMEDATDGYPDVSDPAIQGELRKEMSNSDGEMLFRSAMEDTMVPYTETGYPYVVYLDADTALRANNLLVAIKEYVTQETAKFVTGARSLDELDAYYAELDKLGVEEYVQIYADYYEAIK